ncbi:hemerythrin domain-containing protein [Fluviicola sp.]|jgi:regulator of cell morphogenesis and NO signaling|uniref:hemerythrin domain-containing protein n=1 Tax=Fluviicola sp. TaxID=1917219 RepID=UPI00281AFBC2|nr:hemerythrin domain-containing protein [Fluviicola sp.]MDR0800986.1 hemerythrin domain-containing protein [Fluviicola sp.]
MKEQEHKMELSGRLLKERMDNKPAYSISDDSLRTLISMVEDGITEFPEDLLQSISIRDLLNALKRSHGVYLNTRLPEIEQSIYNLYSKQANSDNVLLMLCGFFISYQKKLVAHIQYEEVFLFPYIQSLLELQKSGKEIDRERFGNFTLKQFFENHSNLEEDLNNVRRKITRHIEGLKTSFAFRIFMTQLEHFEKDLAIHAVLEDAVLLPRLVDMELHLLG